MTYWEKVHLNINREPMREVDRYFMAMLIRCACARIT